MSPTFTLTPDMLATGNIGVEMRAPNYADLRNARRLFPFEKAERGDRIGYVPDDLMLASLLVSVNGKPVTHCNDLIERLDLFPLSDRQAISALLVETFYLDKPQANLAAAKARTQRVGAYNYRDTVKADSPSGTFEVRFMVPTSSVQIECERRYSGIEKAGAGLEEYMFAFCLVSINGVDITDEKDKLNFLDKYEIADVQYATNYFIALSTIDEETRVDLKKHKAAILHQLRATPAASIAVAAQSTPAVSLPTA